MYGKLGPGCSPGCSGDNLNIFAVIIFLAVQDPLAVMPARMLSARSGVGGAGEVSVADSPLATFESLTQAAVIAVMGVAIVVSNILIIASFLNFKGILQYTYNGQ